MPKKGWLIIGISLGVVAIVMAVLYFGMGKPRPQPTTESSAAPSTPSVVGDSELTVTRQGNTAIITPNNAFKGRTPFYLDEKAGWGDKFYFMYYRSEQKSFFYSFDTAQEEDGTLCERLFEIEANVDSGEVVDDGNGLVYRELVDGSYAEGALKYLKKDGSAVTLVNQCIYYSDKKKVLAGGLDPDNPGQTERKFYLYNFLTGKRTLLEAFFCPQTLEELIGVAATWNSNSRYISMIDKLVDADTGGKLKKDFATNDATLTMFSWSPDGQKLAFLSQNSQNANYSLDLENTSLCLSERIGIYNTWDGSVRYVDIADGLALEFVWGDDSKGLAARVVPAANLDAFISSYQPDNTNPGEGAESFTLITIDLANLTTEPVLENYPVQSIHKYYDGKLLITHPKKGRPYIAVYDPKTKTTRNLVPGSTLTTYQFRDRFLMALADGIYTLTPNSKANRVVKWDQNYPVLAFSERNQLVYSTNDRVKVVDLNPKEP